MFDKLGDQLSQAISTLSGQHRISDINIARALKDIRRALVSADVNYKLAKEVTEQIKQQTLNEQIKLSVSPAQYFTKLTADALSELMGTEKTELSLKKKPSILLVAGLQGAGKTTFSAKLALYLKKKGHSTALIACDVYRPNAVEQLQILGQQINVPVYSTEGSKDPIEVARTAQKTAREKGASVIIIDTAGRLAIDQKMMEELKSLQTALVPENTLLVLDAMMGQDAVQTAQTFQAEIDFNGVVLTKLDGDTRGGAALSIKAATGKPILFSSQGEQLDALDLFYPDRMARRILGMGDVLSLVEKAQEHFEEKEAQQIAKKFAKNTFDFNDFLKQLQRIRKMGKTKDLIGLLPGMSKKLNMLDDEDMLKKPEVIIQSMTPYERKNPHMIKNTRKIRIAEGSGNTINEVNNLLRRYDLMRKMMRKAATGDPKMLKSLIEKNMK